MADSGGIHELTSAVARYHAGCLRVIGSQNVALKDVRSARKSAMTCDVGEIAGFETLHATGGLELHPPAKPKKPKSRSGEAVEPYESELETYERALQVWERMRELAQKAALEPYAKEIFFGAPLLRAYA